MVSEGKSEAEKSWENLPPPHSRLQKTASAVGVRCARDQCPVTKGITYEKPLCYQHWKEFDSFQISECERCHWFDELIGEFSEDDLCHECIDRERRGFPPVPVYAHDVVIHQIRYLYILKLSDGKFYIGQTNNLEVRLEEHMDGVTSSTAQKKPKLVYFETWVGFSDELNQEEQRLTRLATRNPRAIRVKVQMWQKPLRLIDLNA